MLVYHFGSIFFGMAMAMAVQRSRCGEADTCERKEQKKESQVLVEELHLKQKFKWSNGVNF
jgi:hypothetical protein